MGFLRLFRKRAIQVCFRYELFSGLLLMGEFLCECFENSLVACRTIEGKPCENYLAL